MTEAIRDVLAVAIAAVATAAATAAVAYLLVLAPQQPLYAVLSVLLLATFILLIYFGFVKMPVQPAPPPAARPVAPLPQPTAPPAVAPETVVYIARLEAEGGKVIPITGVRQVFGRRDFEGLVDPALVRAISREHFTIFYDFKSGKFFIEDRSSLNGTYLNEVNIRGKGPVELKEGDVISPAGVVRLVFKVGA